MNALVKKLIENEKFEQYAKDVKEKISPISLSGLSDVGKAHIIISTAENLKCPIFILTYNEMQAKEMINSLKFFRRMQYFTGIVNNENIGGIDFNLKSQ